MPKNTEDNNERDDESGVGASSSLEDQLPGSLGSPQDLKVTLINAAVGIDRELAELSFEKLEAAATNTIAALDCRDRRLLEVYYLSDCDSKASAKLLALDPAEVRRRVGKLRREILREIKAWCEDNGEKGKKKMLLKLASHMKWCVMITVLLGKVIQKIREIRGGCE